MISGLLLPLAVLAATWYAHSYAMTVSPRAIELSAYAALFVAIALSVAFNRSRALFCALVVGAAFWVLNVQEDPAPANSLIYVLICIVVPLNTLLFCLTHERGILSAPSAVRFTLVILQALALAWFLERPSFELFAWLTQEFVGTPRWLALSIPQAGIVVLAVCALSIVVRMFFDPTPLDSAFLGLLAALFIGYNWIGTVGILASFHAAAAVLLIIGVVRESYNMAYRDELTNLPGRRALNEKLAALGRKYVIAMVDVDHFKKFNDTYGHDVGDQVLRMVAAKLKRVTGRGKAYRYGGEEFALIFAGVGINDAVPHVEAVRLNIADYRMALRGRLRPVKDRRKKRRASRKSKASVSVTVSAGVAERTDALKTPEDVVKAADEALYRAKRAGRNRVKT